MWNLEFSPGTAPAHPPPRRGGATAADRMPPRTDAGRFASPLVNQRKKQMKKIATGIAAAAAVFAFAGAADAQTAPTTPFSVEVRGGIALPTGDFSDLAQTGYDFGANASFGFSPNAAVYAGYTFNSFSGDDDALGLEDVDFEVKGFNGGVRLGVPVGMAGLAPYVKGGAVYYEGEIDVDGLGDADEEENESKWGFEVGGGVAIPLGMRGSFTPEVRYTDVEDLNFVTVDVGLRFRI